MPAINPLDANHLAGAQMVIQTTDDLIKYLEACQQCGLPAQDRIDTVKAQDEFCRKVCKNFFPDYQIP